MTIDQMASPLDSTKFTNYNEKVHTSAHLKDDQH